MRILQPMKLTDVTPEWIRARLHAKGWPIYRLATMIPLERTKVSKSLKGKRNFIGWELARIAELLDETPAHATIDDPEIRSLLGDYLALSEEDRQKARAVMHALRFPGGSEGPPPVQGEPRESGPEHLE